MMLKTIKAYIQEVELSQKSFSEFYVEYMMKVQDSDLELEVNNLINHSILQTFQYDSLIEGDYRKLVNTRNAQFKRSK